MNKLQRQIVKLYIPGTPSIPAVPGYCYQVKQVVPGAVIPGGTQPGYYSLEDIRDMGGLGAVGYAVPRYIPVDPYIDGSGNFVTQELIGYTVIRGAPSGPAYTTTTKTVCVPGTPGVQGIPATYAEQGAGPDWRAAARSIDTVSGDAAATFDVSPSPRVVVGFASTDRGPNVADIRMGVSFAPSAGGVLIRPVIDGVQAAAVGQYAAGDRTELARVAGRFTIRVGGTTVYTGAATTDAPVFLDAMLYTSADYVDNPTLAAATAITASGSIGVTAGISTTTGVSGRLGVTGDVNLLADGEALLFPTGRVGVTAEASLVEIEVLSVLGTIGLSWATPVFDGHSGANLTLTPLALQASNYVVANGAVVLSALEAEGYGGVPTIEVAGGDLAIAPMVASGVMYTGSLLTGNTALQSMTMLAADRPYAAVAVTMSPLTVYADDGFGVANYYGFNTDVKLIDWVASDPALVASWQDGLEVQPTMSIALLLDGAIFDDVLLGSTATLQAIVSAMIASGVTLRTANRIPATELQQLAFEVATGAATRYDQFEFTQFVTTNEGTFGIKPDGVYKLRTGDDDGVERSALVDFGATAFGTSKIKHIHNMYLGVSGDGDVYVKLSGDGNNYRTYRVLGSTPSRKVRTGRNLTAREWAVGLEWVDSTSIELDSVEFVIAGSSTRRIG